MRRCRATHIYYTVYFPHTILLTVSSVISYIVKYGKNQYLNDGWLLHNDIFFPMFSSFAIKIKLYGCFLYAKILLYFKKKKLEN